MLDEHIYGRWKKKQYLVKWKGYPDLNNQWLDAKNMENTQELIAEFHNSNPEFSSHIKRAFKCLSHLRPPSTLPPTLASEHMSDASTLAELPFGNKENTSLLPIPPCMATPDVSSSQLCVQNPTPATFICIRDSNFPHPDKPTSELNDSDQENITPPTPAVPCTSPLFKLSIHHSEGCLDKLQLASLQCLCSLIQTTALCVFLSQVGDRYSG